MTTNAVLPEDRNPRSSYMCDNQPRCQAIRPHSSLHACGGCQSVFYCNATCQKKDWVTRHRHTCQAMAAQRKRRLEKKARKAKKLAKAKREAELNHQSFNASLSAILMSDSDDSDDDGDLLASSRTSLSENEALHMSGGSLTSAEKKNNGSVYLNGSLSLLSVSPKQISKKRDNV